MWRELWDRHKGKLIGLAAGLFFGMVYLFSGFWDMLVVAFILFLCIYAGKMLDEKDGFPDVEDWLRKWNDTWKRFK